MDTIMVFYEYSTLCYGLSTIGVTACNKYDWNRAVSGLSAFQNDSKQIRRSSEKHAQELRLRTTNNSAGSAEKKASLRR
ncbi:hypothetical protein [Sphingomonas turrisvirgatae]|uniref:hypothetical protein n=1 Tax=Sphingomonas turrisvirgatae TaxID=1888892 RepID=UPI0019D407A0|nr:hypothetical protein [Sphingomonas turrisvirgatae]